MTKAVCIVDTSVLLELLDVPDKSDDSAMFVREFEGRVKAGEAMLLPLTAILEAGNFVGQVGSGKVRRKLAEKLVAIVAQALLPASPFTLTPLPDQKELAGDLDRFVDWCKQRSGLGDLLIKTTWERQCALQPKQRRVYVWSKDAHLQGYDRR